MNTIDIVYGDILQQSTDVIVNPWNRNFIPWWLLLPQGVSGAIKKHAGYQPFKELAHFGLLDVGQAVLTSAGRLTYKGIIHVAGLNAWWYATEYSIKKSVESALILAQQSHFSSIALPLIGAGTGGKQQEKVQQWIIDTINDTRTELKVILVVFDAKN